MPTHEIQYDFHTFASEFIKNNKKWTIQTRERALIVLIKAIRVIEN